MFITRIFRNRHAGALTALLLAPVHFTHAAEGPKAEESRAATEKKLESAQQRLDAAAREVADLSMSLSDGVMRGPMHFAGLSRQRAVLGVGIGRGDAGQADGVEIVSVSPGGSAAQAGLQVGDVLTEVNGKALVQKGDDSPHRQLLTVMRDVKPGDKLNVRYRRGNKALSTTVVAAAPADRMFNMALPMEGLAQRFENFPRLGFMHSDGVFGSAEMVALTPKLGQYFGTEKGLLVVRAPGDDRLKLEEGDVVVDIDGRVPESAAHAARILGSYEAGEKLQLNVLRMKKRVTLAVDVPSQPAGGMNGRRTEGPRFMPAPPGAPMPGSGPGPGSMPPPPGVRGSVVLRSDDSV